MFRKRRLFKRTMRKNGPSAGFSLVEAIIAMSLVAIVAAATLTGLSMAQMESLATTYLTEGNGAVHGAIEQLQTVGYDRLIELLDDGGVLDPSPFSYFPTSEPPPYYPDKDPETGEPALLWGISPTVVLDPGEDLSDSEDDRTAVRTVFVNRPTKTVGGTLVPENFLEIRVVVEFEDFPRVGNEGSEPFRVYGYAIVSP